MKKTVLNTALLAALGVTGLPLTAQAINLPNGDYEIRINVTPTVYISGLGTVYVAGKDGAWNSSFTFGGSAPKATSQGMPDTAACATGTDGNCRGSGIIGDSLAGVIDISVSNDVVAITSFSKDMVPSTAGGDFVQYYGPGFGVAIPNAVTSATSGPCGLVDSATSTLTLFFTNRQGAINSPALHDRDWNVPPSSSLWLPFTTQSATTSLATINGASLTNIGDVNSDMIDDYSAILVTGGEVGDAWESFSGAEFFEVWNVQILSVDNSPAVALASCNPGAPPSSTISDPVINSIQNGAHGCSLSSATASVADGGAWALIAGFLAWLRGLTWWRRRNNAGQT